MRDIQDDIECRKISLLFAINELVSLIILTLETTYSPLFHNIFPESATSKDTNLYSFTSDFNTKSIITLLLFLLLFLDNKIRQIFPNRDFDLPLLYTLTKPRHFKVLLYIFHSLFHSSYFFRKIFCKPLK